jgi:hypothetical protein
MTTWISNLVQSSKLFLALASTIVLGLGPHRDQWQFFFLQTVKCFEMIPFIWREEGNVHYWSLPLYWEVATQALTHSVSLCNSLMAHELLRTEVTLRLTDGQSSPPWDLRPDTNSVWILLCCLCWAHSLTRGRVCLLSVTVIVNCPSSSFIFSFHPPPQFTRHTFYIYTIYALRERERTKENHGKPWSSWPVAGPSGCKLTTSQQSGVEYASPSILSLSVRLLYYSYKIRICFTDVLYSYNLDKQHTVYNP